MDNRFLIGWFHAEGGLFRAIDNILKKGLKIRGVLCCWRAAAVNIS